MKLTIPDGNFKAYLFDCDGTIVDSMPLHFVAWGKALAEWKCTFTEEQFYTWGGRPVDEIITALNEAQGLKMPVNTVFLRKEQFYLDMLPRLKGVPEVLEQIERNHGKIPLAVVSGSPRGSVEASLDILGIRSKFEVLVCAGEYARESLILRRSLWRRICSASLRKTAWSLKMLSRAFEPPRRQGCNGRRLVRRWSVRRDEYSALYSRFGFELMAGRRDATDSNAA